MIPRPTCPHSDVSLAASCPWCCSRGHVLCPQRVETLPYTRLLCLCYPPLICYSPGGHRLHWNTVSHLPTGTSNASDGFLVGREWPSPVQTQVQRYTSRS
uniref:Uncharacterized protein n=1 Tax=Cacopsylla melanoneura TaxID=428564 RepID=A0A8D9EP95_9HEMI